MSHQKRNLKRAGGGSSGKGQAVPLRWQDLPEDDPDKWMIIVAPEDYMPVRGKGKGKGKGKMAEKENEKPKKGKGKKAEGPPLANYIKIGEFSLACRMCPNPDRHPTFHCPNLTPELKERLKESRLKLPTFRAFHPDDVYCYICLSKDHWSSACKYQINLPRGAEVGPHAEIVCMCCGEVSPHPVDWMARAILKPSCLLGNPEAVRSIANGSLKQAISS